MPPAPLGHDPTALSFQVLAEIAAGETARVDLCRVSAGPAEGRLVAVKRLHPHLADDPAFVAQFRDEMWMNAALRHPNVVEVVGWGSDDKGLYLAVELVQGVSLARLMKTIFDTGEAFTERMGVFIARQIVRGLAAAHALRAPSGELLGLVHRDLTPGNVLVSFQGDVKITDFGLAKAKQRLTRTLTGVVKGQIEYIAPEQAHGSNIDHRADIFSLGVLLFELFAGRRPWVGNNDIELAMALMTAPPADLFKLRPKIHRELVLLVDRCLEKDPAARFQSTAEILTRLDDWLSAHGYNEDNEEALGRFVRRNAMRQMAWFERAIAGVSSQPPMTSAEGRTISKPRPPTYTGTPARPAVSPMPGASDDDDDDDAPETARPGKLAVSPPTVRSAKPSPGIPPAPPVPGAPRAPRAPQAPVAAPRAPQAPAIVDADTTTDDDTNIQVRVAALHTKSLGRAPRIEAAKQDDASHEVDWGEEVPTLVKGASDQLAMLRQQFRGGKPFEPARMSPPPPVVEDDTTANTAPTTPLAKARPPAASEPRSPSLPGQIAPPNPSAPPPPLPPSSRTTKTRPGGMEAPVDAVEERLRAEAERLSIEAMRLVEEAKSAYARAERKAALAKACSDAAAIAQEAVRLAGAAGVGEAMRRLEVALAMERSARASEGAAGAGTSTMPPPLAGVWAQSPARPGEPPSPAGLAPPPIPPAPALPAPSIPSAPPVPPLSVAPGPRSVAPPSVPPRISPVPGAPTFGEPPFRPVERQALPAPVPPSALRAESAPDVDLARLRPRLLGMPRPVAIAVLMGVAALIIIIALASC